MKLTSRKTQVSNVRDIPIIRRRFRLNSFGFRLFLVIMGGAISGIGGMAFLFGEMLKYQAEDKIKDTLRSKVILIEHVTHQAETIADGLNISVATLHVRRAETPQTYEELAHQFFQDRPEFVQGLGFGQKEYGILPSQQWFFPYYESLSPALLTEEAAQSATAQFSTSVSLSDHQDADSHYIDQADPKHFYPETDRYRNYFLPQVDRWTLPYASDRGILLSYYSQIFDDQGEWLGTTVIDVDGTHLSSMLSESVLRNGGDLVLLTANGDVIANPANPNEVGTQTYKDIPGLSDVWTQISPETPGFFEGETGYWAYTQIPERDWLVLAHVPYSVVFGQVMLITLGATTVIGLLLAGIVAVAIRNVNRHLRPVLNECHRLSTLDEAMMKQLQNKDELEQLSLSFFYLLDQLTQKLPMLSHATQRMQSLEQLMATTANEEQQQSQLVTQVQQWVNTTGDLSRVLTRQARAVNSVGKATSENLEASQQKIASVMSELQLFRHNTHQLPEQMQALLVATDRTTQVTREHHHIINRAKALILNGFNLSTQLSQQPGQSEFKGNAAQFQRLITQFQALTDRFSQALTEQQDYKREIQAVSGDLNRCIKAFDRHMKQLGSRIEASQKALGKSQMTGPEIMQLGEQVTESSRKLGELMQTIQRTVRNMVVIADAAQTRLHNGHKVG